MTAVDALWILGGYLAGTFPSTWLVSRLTGATGVIRASRREVSETDPHILLNRRIGGGWAALAAILDVSKGIALPLAARRWGGLGEPWVAMAGVAVVVGHAFPFYLRAMSGRGLAAASGVYLALLPIPMVIAGVMTLVGIFLRQTGAFSTVGFGSVPLTAWLLGQPGAHVAMGAAVFALILIRRIEGTSDMMRRTGLSRVRAAAYRAVFDRSDLVGDGASEATGEERSQA